jgi:hypothetical protein
MMETDGFTKAIVRRKARKILGYHHRPAGIGPDTGSGERHGRRRKPMVRGQGMHIHPALSEVVLKAFGSWMNRLKDHADLDAVDVRCGLGLPVCIAPLTTLADLLNLMLS